MRVTQTKFADDLLRLMLLNATAPSYTTTSQEKFPVASGQSLLLLKNVLLNIAIMDLLSVLSSRAGEPMQRVEHLAGSSFQPGP